MKRSDLNVIIWFMQACTAQHTVPANELAIKALLYSERRARAVHNIDGHGNEGFKPCVESSGTKTGIFGLGYSAVIQKTCCSALADMIVFRSFSALNS